MDLNRLEPTPILDGAVCMGVRREKGSPDLLIFASPRYGEIQIAVATTGGGRVIFSYVIHDPKSHTVTTYRGFHGDPMKDAVVDVTTHE